MRSPATSPRSLISDRILTVELARRGSSLVPADLEDRIADWPPLSLMAGATFPDWVLDRRQRVIIGMGVRLPGVVHGLDELDESGRTAEDYVTMVRSADRVETDDLFLACLARSVGVGVNGPTAPVDGLVLLELELAQAAGPPATDVRCDQPPVYARMEAVTLSNDRFFGRRPGRSPWELAGAALSTGGDWKRRVAASRRRSGR
ncbi:MAG TPA: hypothetical protein VG435_09275 [Acidimicrobiales bacterium]|nr:hypothetical protein [Acidimicrobiales bacterium]